MPLHCGNVAMSSQCMAATRAVGDAKSGLAIWLYQSGKLPIARLILDHERWTFPVEHGDVFIAMLLFQKEALFVLGICR